MTDEILANQEGSYISLDKENVPYVVCLLYTSHGGLEPLQERLCVRPTSETLFCDFYAKEIQSHRDLPKVYNCLLYTSEEDEDSKLAMQISKLLSEEDEAMMEEDLEDFFKE